MIAMLRIVLAIGLCAACRRAPAPAAPVTSGADGAETAVDAKRRCYPYQPRADRSCPTECATRDDCQGSRGPADFAENGWPLDCIQRACVPLPPEHVTGRP